MYLLLDNTQGETIVIHSANATKEISIHQFDRTRVGSLLGAIDQLLLNLSLSRSDIQGVAVVGGQGRFTATRVAVTVGNMLALTLQIPVITVPTTAEGWLTLLQQHKAGTYALPHYSGPPRLGGKEITYAQ